MHGPAAALAQLDGERSRHERDREHDQLRTRQDGEGDPAEGERIGAVSRSDRRALIRYAAHSDAGYAALGQEARDHRPRNDDREDAGQQPRRRREAERAREQVRGDRGAREQDRVPTVRHDDRIRHLDDREHRREDEG